MDAEGMTRLMLDLVAEAAGSAAINATATAIASESVVDPLHMIVSPFAASSGFVCVNPKRRRGGTI